MARDDARFATGAGVEIDLEGVLLAGFGRLGGQERGVTAIRSVGELFMSSREFLDGGKFGLLREQSGDVLSESRGITHAIDPG